MDLRQRHLTAAQLDDVKMFIRQRKLAYQPFEFSDTLQVGEGQRFRDGEFADRCGTVLWESHPAEVADLITKDPAAFREANRELRRIYDGIVDFIVRNAGDDVTNLSFAEFGCNTGYFLHSLAARGARKTTGYDFTENSAVFRWFNEVLGIPAGRNEFRFAEWDSLNHRVRHATFDEADVCMSIAVTCHLADPLHHLAFLCSKARRAVFFWCPVNFKDNDGLSISFGTPGKYPNSLSFPIDIDNDVRLSPALIRLTLERCGFGKLRVEIEHFPPSVPGSMAGLKSQLGFVALRTSSPATVYTNGRTRRKIPSDALVSAETTTAETHWDLESDDSAHQFAEETHRKFNCRFWWSIIIAASISCAAKETKSWHWTRCWVRSTSPRLKRRGWRRTRSRTERSASENQWTTSSGRSTTGQSISSCIRFRNFKVDSAH